MPSDVSGTWSYRSFLNDPDLARPFDELRFGAGTLVLEAGDDGALGGTLGGEGWSLGLSGTVAAGTPVRLRYQGRGEIGGETWVYDYLGFLVSDWPNGVGQVDAIVGSIVRTEPHSNGQATAGFVASWYAVRA